MYQGGGESYSSKNPYGNKTTNILWLQQQLSYSSENPYGNKTVIDDDFEHGLSYSSKNPYGNKTVNHILFL